MKHYTLAFALLFAVSLTAGVKPGENILFNGELLGSAVNPTTGKPATVPDLWETMGAAEGVRFIVESGAAKGKGLLRFSQVDPSKPAKEITVKQPALILVEGEKYRISAMVRTSGFESPHCGIVVCDRGWYHDTGIHKFPKNQDWTPMSAEVTMISPNKGKHSFAMFACDFKGTLEIKDVKLEALSEKAQKESEKSELISLVVRPLLIPMTPLVNQITIPEANDAYPQLTFQFNGNLPENTACDDYDIRYAVNDLPEDSVKLRNGLNTIVFKNGVKPGDFKLKVSIVDRAKGNAVCTQEYTATFVTPVKTSDKDHKRLNNLVVEVLNKPIQKSAPLRGAHSGRAEPQTFTFCTMRDGWVFIAAQNAEADSLEVTLDNSLKVINAKTPRLETFRDISKGKHTLTVKGAANGGNLIVRTIPEIYSYKPCCDSMVPENPPYDWDFQNKYAHYALTTHNDGIIPEQYRKEFFESGRKWIGSVGTISIPADSLVKLLNTCVGMNAPQYQGVSCDEQGFGSFNSIVYFKEGMKRFKAKNDHVTYTWIVGKPTMKGVDDDFLSACVNVCRGRGRVLSEVYISTRPTLEEAKKYLDEVIVDKAIAFREFFPEIINHWGMIFGNFIQIPVISLAHHPNVDYKYYLDMQFNLLANHPACKDMAITGYWGTRHCDFELFRWCFMLTRHYCVEGKKTMLSDEYGFSYAPVHILNNDFIDGLHNW